MPIGYRQSGAKKRNEQNGIGSTRSENQKRQSWTEHRKYQWHLEQCRTKGRPYRRDDRDDRDRSYGALANYRADQGVDPHEGKSALPKWTDSDV